MDFEILKFLPLLVAIFFAWKLRSVLGTRNGSEESHKYDMQEFKTKEEEKADSNVVALPGVQTDNNQTKNTEEADDVSRKIDEIAGEDETLKQGLKEIRATDSTFDPESFLGGAKIAYEMIVTAYADGDVQTLRNLLNEEVSQNFENAIEERTKKGEKIQAKFVGVEQAKIVGAVTDGDNAGITVDFVCQMVSATLNKNGEVIEGDEHQVVENTDKWVFSRSITSDDPNWKLVATDA